MKNVNDNISGFNISEGEGSRGDGIGGIIGDCSDDRSDYRSVNKYAEKFWFSLIFPVYSFSFFYSF